LIAAWTLAIVVSSIWNEGLGRAPCPAASERIASTVKHATELFI
jgi:hypothetical protein